MKSRLLIGVLLTICGTMFPVSSVRAGCITSPNPNVDLVTETALVFWQDGIQQLILQPVFTSHDADQRTTRVGYFVPVPSSPKSYGIVDDSTVSTAWHWLARISQKREPGSDIEPASVDLPYTLPSTARNNQYEITIQPSARELTAWLETNAFSQISTDALQSYPDGCSFVTVIATLTTPFHGTTDVALQPIHVTFASDRIILPVRISQPNGPFHAYLIVGSAQPINVANLRPNGFVPLDDATTARQDRILAQAGICDSTRAILWYDLAGLLYDSDRVHTTPDGRDREVEKRGLRLNKRVRDWTEAPVNRLTAFASQPDSVDEFDTEFEAARRDNAGDAPPAIVTAYHDFAQSTSTQPCDSLYISALVAPWLNTPGTETDLANWSRDPAIRLRDLFTALPRLAPPWPTEFAIVDTAWTPPAPELLPMPDNLIDILTELLQASSRDELLGLASQALAQDQAAPNVRFHRQLAATNRIASLFAPTADSLQLPSLNLPATHPRSIASIERAVRAVRVPLQAVWVAAQYSAERPNPLVVAIRMHIAATGDVTVVETRGNLPNGTPETLLRAVFERHITLPPSGSEVTFDFVFVVES